MRLHVGVVRTEQRLRAGDRRALGDVDELTPAVIALPRVAFGVLVGHHRPGGFEHGAADEVFRRDELEAAVLPVPLVADRAGDLGVGFGEGAPDRRGRGWCRHTFSLG
jgi:hypothetical protein